MGGGGAALVVEVSGVETGAMGAEPGGGGGGIPGGITPEEVKQHQNYEKTYHSIITRG